MAFRTSPTSEEQIVIWLLSENKDKILSQEKQSLNMKSLLRTQALFYKSKPEMKFVWILEVETTLEVHLCKKLILETMIASSYWEPDRAGLY